MFSRVRGRDMTHKIEFLCECMKLQKIVNIVIIVGIVFLGIVVLINIPDDSNISNQIARDLIWDWLTPYVLGIVVLLIFLCIGLFRSSDSGGN